MRVSGFRVALPFSVKVGLLEHRSEVNLLSDDPYSNLSGGSVFRTSTLAHQNLLFCRVLINSISGFILRTKNLQKSIFW